MVSFIVTGLNVIINHDIKCKIDHDTDLDINHDFELYTVMNLVTTGLLLYFCG